MFRACTTAFLAILVWLSSPAETFGAGRALTKDEAAELSAEILQHISNLDGYLAGRGITGDLRDDLKQEGALYIMAKAYRLKDPKFRGFNPRLCALVAWRSLGRQGARMQRLAIDPIQVEKLWLPPAGLDDEDVRKYFEDLAGLERDKPRELGIMVATAAIRHPDRNLVLAACAQYFPNAARHAAEALKARDAAALAGNEQARNTFNQRVHRISTLWPWALAGILVVVSVYRWGGGGEQSAPEPAPSPPSQSSPTSEVAAAQTVPAMVRVMRE